MAQAGPGHDELCRGVKWQTKSGPSLATKFVNDIGAGASMAWRFIIN